MFILKVLAGGIILYAITIVLTSIIQDLVGVVLIVNIILGMIIIVCTYIIIQTIKQYTNKTDEKE
ncbi:hypothetical protein [Caldisalinibacter kiritimatiensis]|uniref:hypothetical protein n=1 Tax=Caldisalinibacter kiritimatiensis TaxID=1304284 RepID=UPI0004B67E19|nr:hypothetical protein [Caldisalinibacter kiritimatiensis]